METIRDVSSEDREAPVSVESRDDLSAPSFMDEDLVLPHLLGRTASDDGQRDEAIEIVNMSFLHE